MILIVDLGSQYTHLIKRNCRDLDFEATIINDSQTAYQPENVEKIILSGGPKSVYNRKPALSERMVEHAAAENMPLLGICFGHQLLAHQLGGKVERGKSAEYGLTKIYVDKEDILLRGLPKTFNAWASHFDEVITLPRDFAQLAHSEINQFEAMKHKTKALFGLQFHPEVWHTENGERILENFLKI
ncbi:MAG TPA: GMP synthase subunit A [Candidatus Bilamarchaeaceae archaeon]|nr:GMP synthase subunit A [Candidatus Bilamarchaeaceae archaeon]